MKKNLLCLCLAAFGAGSTMAADPAKINWAKIPTVTVPLFYPGQSSYEWLTSDAHKGASKEVRRGDDCTSCHDEEDAEKDMGNKIESYVLDFIRENHPGWDVEFGACDRCVEVYKLRADGVM